MPSDIGMVKSAIHKPFFISTFSDSTGKFSHLKLSNHGEHPNP